MFKIDALATILPKIQNGGGAKIRNNNKVLKLPL